MLKNAIEKISKFYEIDMNKDPQCQAMFDVLGDIVRFDSVAIFYFTSSSLVLKFSKNYLGVPNVQINSEILFDTTSDITNYIKSLLNLETPAMVEYLTIKNVPIGIILMARKKEKFSVDECLVFKTCAKIIANMIKDFELSEVLKLQAKAMAEGINETHIAYETIKKQNKKIKQNEKLQNQFIANVSHDLRTPLNSIISMTEILSKQFFGKLNEKQQDYINDIRVAGLKLLGMINEILDIAKIDSKTIKLNLTEFKLSDAIFEVCNIIEPLAIKNNLKLEKNLDQNIILCADYVKIQQIILNILSNAIKYAKTKVQIRTYQQERRIVLSIKDDGIGIAKSNHKKIFKKFYQVGNTLSKTEASTGLGLTIAKEFTKLHGGKITLISEEDLGAEFIIEFPQ